MKAITKIASEPFVAGSLQNMHIVEHTAGHIALKQLIQNDKERIHSGKSGSYINSACNHQQCKIIYNYDLHEKLISIIIKFKGIYFSKREGLREFGNYVY
jgi:hypothetical protein